MRIRPATVSDAASIAALVRAHETVLVEDECSASPFWESMSELAHAQNLASVRFRYWVAESEHLLLGFIAFRDETHLFNLFVSPGHQRQGVARKLWQFALPLTTGSTTGRTVTVNASLNAVPAYRALGFTPAGEVTRHHGIAFLPMRWQTPNAD